MFLTENELEVMNVLWSSNGDLSRNDIIERAPDRSWKDNSIHPILNSLMKKNLVKVVGMKQSGKIYGRTYSADITKEQYIANQMTGKSDSAENSMVGLFAALAKDATVSDETLKKLQDILDEMKKGNKQQ